MLSVIIPVYRSERIIEALTSELINSIDPLGFEYEVIFVCDASPDNSWNQIRTICESKKNFKGVLLRKNVGQHNAIIVGIEHSSGANIITMDDDLQHSPSDIPVLLAKLDEGFDVVYANFQNRSHSLWKVMGSRITNLVMTKFSGKPKEIYLSPFRAINRSIGQILVDSSTRNTYIDGSILNITSHIAMVDVVHHERLLGKGNYSLRKSISLWLKMLTNATTAPLRLVSFLGLSLSFISFFSIILVFLEHLRSNYLPNGWASLMISIMFLGGIQLIGLGIIGEYLARVFTFTSKQTNESVREKIGKFDL